MKGRSTDPFRHSGLPKPGKQPPFDKAVAIVFTYSDKTFEIEESTRIRIFRGTLVYKPAYCLKLICVINSILSRVRQFLGMVGVNG
jgi:hypothetical protein